MDAFEVEVSGLRIKINSRRSLRVAPRFGAACATVCLVNSPPAPLEPCQSCLVRQPRLRSIAARRKRIYEVEFSEH